MTSAGSTAKLLPFVFLSVLLSLVLSAVAGLQLFQDGSSYLFELLVSNSAVRHHRVSVYLIQAPFILAAKLFGRLQLDPDATLGALRLIFGLSYAAVPLVSLLLSWLVVRRRNEGLLIWAALIVLFVNLVNFSWVSELLIALQLLCPLLLAALVMPGTRAFWLLTVLILPFVFFLHPLATALFTAIAICSAYISYKDGGRRRAARLNAIVFFTAAVLRGLFSLFSMTEYEASFAEPTMMSDYLLASGWQTQLFLVLSLVIGLICLQAQSLAQSSPRSLERLYRAAMILAAVGACFLVSLYLFDGGRFHLKTGLALFAAMVLMLMAAHDSLRTIGPFENLQRRKLMAALAAIFLLTILSKALMWHASTEKLAQVLAAYEEPCVEKTVEDFSWLGEGYYNFIDNWALPTLALVMQDEPPRRLLLEAGDCRAFYQSGMVQIDPWSNLPKNAVVPPVD